MPNENVILILQEAVMSAIHEAANEEIKKHKARFEQEMQTAKQNVVNDIVNTIHIQVSQNIPGGEYIIQIRLNGGK